MTDETVLQLEPVAPDRQDGLILIAEDDVSQADVLCHRLEKQGFRTLTAGSGQSCMQLAMQEQPDLILLDLRLPDASGFDICERLADGEITSHIPVIIVSGMESPDIVRRTRLAGSRFFIRKPYDPNVLLTLIEKAFSSSW